MLRVMSQLPDPLARMRTRTKRQGESGTIDVKALVAEDEKFPRVLVRMALQEVLWRCAISAPFSVPIDLWHQRDRRAAATQ
ncbi:MAG TPA: hypothetical protein VGJ20_29650 [Xanthobacteraceae bacterium]